MASSRSTVSQVRQLVVGVALVGDCPAVAFDGGPRSLASACQVVLGPFELPLGHDEIVAGGAPLTTRSPSRGDVWAPAWTRRASTARASAASQGVAVVGGGRCDLGQRRIGSGDGGGRRRLVVLRRRADVLLGDREASLGVGEDLREPLRHLAPS